MRSVRAVPGRARVVSRRPFVLVFPAVVGAVLALGSAPAAASAGSGERPHPQATATTSTPTHGHGHGHAHGTPGKAPAKRGTPSASPSIKPRIATTTSSGTATGHRDTPVWSEPTRPKPKPAAAAPSPATKPSAKNDVQSTWRRQDADHADRGVVRAFASDLKTAGKSAGFPALLVVAMVVFLLVQHRLAQRDATLSPPDRASDHALESSAPTTTRP